jgi:uncharacterized protein (TIGR00251 family)
VASQGFELNLWVQPGASRTRIVGLHGDPPRLKIQVAAPPESGKANEALLRFLKKTFGGRVELLAGAASRAKTVRIQTQQAVWDQVLGAYFGGQCPEGVPTKQEKKKA